MTIKFEANKNEVLIWLGETKEPNIVQPSWPDGTPWANDEEATKWAEAWIEASKNPDSEFLAGNSPEQPLIPRPIEEKSESNITEA